MKLSDARKLARSLMEKHGILSWRLKFDRAWTRFGYCDYQNHTLSLSKKLVQLNEPDTVQKTILHEIAHALAGPNANHGPSWVKVARSIGHAGNRCYDANQTITPPARVEGVCPKCSKVIKRMKRGRLACSDCCSKFNFGKFSSEYLFTWRYV